MLTSTNFAAVAVTADADGRLLAAVRDDLGLCPPLPGPTFPELVDAASREKATRFLETLRERGSAFQWALNAPLRGDIVPIFFSGVACGKEVLLLGSELTSPLLDLLEHVLHGTPDGSELASAWRAFEEGSGRMAPHEPAAIYDEMMRMNNELANKERELARANATLARKHEELRKAHDALQQKREALEEANARLERVVRTDPLTGAANRRAFGEHLERELKRSGRTGEPFSVLLFDVDSFKAYNDTFGHAWGDEVLRRLASVVREQLRATDTLSRYGGEEFAIVLPGSDAPVARTVAEKVCTVVASYAWPNWPIRISVGAATAHSGLHGVWDIVDLADHALYAAKTAGRNRSCHIADLQGD